MDNRPRPDTMNEWVQRQDRMTADAPRGGAMGPTTVIGTVVQPPLGSKIGVLLDDAQTVLPIVSVPGDYSPQYGDQVACTRSKLGWHIVQKLSAANMYVPQQAIPLSNGWHTYDSTWHVATVGRSGEGIIALSGLIAGGTLTAGTVIATLPPWARPDLNLVFGIENADTARTVEVRSNGDIVLRSGISAAFISLIDIKFPAAGVANWTNITTFLNGWAPYYFGGFANGYAPPRWWVDPNGMMWVQGALAGGSGAADNTPMAVINSPNAQPKKYNHLITQSMDNFGYIGIDALQPGGGSNYIQWKSGTSGNAHVGLTGAVYETTANTAMPFIPVGFQNGWANLGATWTQASYAKSPGGLVYHQGLATAGTMAVPMYGMPVGYLPKAQLPGIVGNSAFLSNRVASAARARLDVAANGAVNPVQGSNGWYSLDSLIYLAEQ